MLCCFKDGRLKRALDEALAEGSDVGINHLSAPERFPFRFHPPELAGLENMDEEGDSHDDGHAIAAICDYPSESWSVLLPLRFVAPTVSSHPSLCRLFLNSLPISSPQCS